MLAYYVVGQLEENGAKVQLPTASAYGVYLPSRLHCRWLNSGFYVYLSSRGCFAYELGNWQSPSRGDRANCDVMDESYVLEGYPHGCGVRLHSMVECLTSLEDCCYCLHLSLDLTVLGEYVVL